MMDKDNSILNKRLPRGLGIPVLLLSLITIFWLSRNVVLFGSKAAVSNIPKDVQISNITANTFTVSYLTDESVTGSIAYGLDSKFGKVAFDVRETTAPLPHRTHYITISNLAPSTKYFFSIVSGDAVFLNNSNPYNITTASSSASSASVQIPLGGLVTLDGNNVPTEAIAYVQSDDSQLLSTLLKTGGGYNFKLDNVLKKDLSGTLTFAPNTVLHMVIENSTLRSQVSLLAGQANPVPAIILSKDYDFSIGSNPISATSASESAQVTGFPTPEINSSSSSPKIISPKTDQQFKDQQPLFEGTAQPNSEVTITVQSNQEINTTVKSDSNGNWQYRPDTKLSPGQHTLTIQTIDASGILRTLSQSFTVFAQGSQFTEPSISPTLQPTPTTTQPSPTILPTITIAPTQPEPTAILTPSVIIITPIVSTPSATATPVVHITTPPIPKSGSSDLIFGFIGIGSIISIGSLLFFLI